VINNQRTSDASRKDGCTLESPELESSESALIGESSSLMRDEHASIDFDIEFYREIYKDLQSLNDSELESHWFNQGNRENRFGSAKHALEVMLDREDVPDDFSVEEYLHLNPDIKASITWEFQAVEHYVKCGQKENRRHSLDDEIGTMIGVDSDKVGARQSIKLDIKFYREIHADLSELSDESLVRHWHSQGYHEGRFANSDHALNQMLQDDRLPAEFDVNNYLKLNKDLSASVDYPFQAVHHYLEHGIQENRRYRVASESEVAELTSSLNVEFYRAFYNDLEQLTDEECVEHWITNGNLEGRHPNIKSYISDLGKNDLVSDKFNIPTYIRRNIDLIGHYPNKWGYLKHYMHTGKNERRQYQPDIADLNFIFQFYGIDFSEFEGSEKQYEVDEILSIIRKEGDLDLYQPVFLNENELLNYYGFKNLAHFDYETYVYSNGEITQHLKGCSRPICMEHFLTVGFRKNLSISDIHSFDPEFYWMEYRAELTHLVRENDEESSDLWECAPVASRLYEHWVKNGIAEGKHANLSVLIKSTSGFRLPKPVLEDIATYQLVCKQWISDPRPSCVYMSFLGHGIGEGRYQVSHSVETCEFYCSIAKSLVTEGNSAAAIRLYEQVLLLVPNYTDALQALGDELIKCSFFARAKDCYQQLVDEGTATEWVFLNLAECFKHLGDFDSATKVLKKARDSFPGDIYINERANELVDTQFHLAHAKAKDFVKMERLDDGKQLVADSLLNFDIQRVTDKVSRNTRTIAIVGNLDLPQCRFYRIDQKVELFSLAGYSVEVFQQTGPLDKFYANLGTYEAVIFYRVPSLPCVVDAINATNVEGIPSIYDVDDLVFDVDHFPPPLHTYAGQISAEVHGSLAIDVLLVEHAISMCDYGIASTESLARKMSKYVRSGKVNVLKNGLSRVHEVSMDSFNRVESDGPITIFYGSGTKAHKNDFHDLVEPAFVELYEKYGNKIRFLIMGYISMTPELEKLGDSLELLSPISEIEDYWEILSENADINLSVLSSTDVTDTKSEIKWLEAAMFSIPSVVSSTETHRDVVTHGETGFLCESCDDFVESIDALIADPQLRRTIGENAKKLVVAEYNQQKQSTVLIDSISEFKQAASCNKLRVAVVNVFYPPQAIGGATRVVHDNVLEMKESFGDELDIQVFCTTPGKVPYATKQYEKDGIKVTAIACPDDPYIDHRITDRNMGNAFAAFLTKFKPDLVHFHCIQRLTESIVSETRMLKIPYVITAHDGWWISDRQFLINENDTVEHYQYHDDIIKSTQANSKRQRALHRELAGAQKILAVSEPFADIYRDAGLKNVITIENGVSGLSRKPKIPSKNGKVRLAHIGGMERHKGLHLIKNVLMSTPTLENIELLVIDHAINFGSMRKEKWGSTDVIFRSKFPQNCVADLYSEIDMLLAPSVWPESYGLVTREAMYCGCWVVASDRGAIGGPVIDGENGFVVSVDNIEELKSVLQAVDDDHNRYLKPPTAELKLRSSAKQAEDLYKLYDVLVGGNRNASVADTTEDKK